MRGLGYTRSETSLFCIRSLFHSTAWGLLALDAKVFTAIVTPFQPDGSLDLAALERLIPYVIEQGSNGVVVNGSTGENPTLTPEEKRLMVGRVRELLKGTSVELVVGCSTNNTQETIQNAKEAATWGADGLLVVVPYYNKPSQRGIYQHFSAIAKAVDCPLMLYNVPSRTMVSVSPQTVAELAVDHPNIVGIKQSMPDMEVFSKLRQLTPSGFKIWSGDDSLTLPMMALGAYGIVSVASHFVGRPIRDMVDAMGQNDLDKARALHLACLDVFTECFFLPNPTVVKAVLSQLGVIGPTLRLPLVEPTPEELGRVRVLVEQVKALQLQTV